MRHLGHCMTFAYMILYDFLLTFRLLSNHVITSYKRNIPQCAHVLARLDKRQLVSEFKNFYSLSIFNYISFSHFPLFAVICSAGSYPASKTTCQPCPNGKYQPSSGAATCNSCPSGKTTLSTGSTSGDDCQREFGSWLCVN